MRCFYTLVLMLCACATMKSQVVINEIILPNLVEIKNTGAGTVPVQAYNLCRFPQYDELQDLTIICGDLNLSPGEIVTVQMATINLNGTDGELGLYFNDNGFGQSANLADYVEWGSTGHARSITAQGAGQWSNGDFVPSWAGCASLEYDGTGNSSSDWISQNTPTSGCAENALDGCGAGGCSLTTAGLSNLGCDDNGTGANASDDIITFSLNPQGTNVGATYNVTVSSGAVNPPSGLYGGITNFSLQAGSAGGGNVIITVTDVDDVSCTATANIVDPGPCSAACALTGTGLTGVACDNNGTDTDPSDDVIDFVLNPIGDNLGATYNVSVNTGVVNPTSAGYGVATGFSLQAGSAGNGNVLVTVTDAQDPNCTLMEMIIDPGTCSDACQILDAGLGNIGCDDNATVGEPTDDIITFQLDPTGLNLATGYTVSVDQGAINPGGANYGAPAAFALQQGSAGGGDVVVTITDNDDLNCTFDVTVTDPGSCSNQCVLLSAGLAGVTCNDAGTPSDGSDDVISFDLNPTGLNLASAYNISVNTGTINPGIANYGSATSFLLQSGSAGGGNVIVTLSDMADPFCTIDVTIVDPGSCSGACNITAAGLTNTACGDNGSASDPSDDLITFELSPDGVNLSGNYSVSVTSGTIQPTGGAYGISTMFSLQPGSAGNGDAIVVITDDADTSCSFIITIADPGTCSEECNIVSVGLSSVSCNNNGTATDTTDDFIRFMLNPTGNNLGTTYNVTFNGGVIIPSSANYGEATLFSLPPGTAGGGNVLIGVSDANNANCFNEVTVIDPGNCPNCQVESGTITALGPTTLCLLDTATTVDVSREGASGTSLQWVITDADGAILGLPVAPPFEFALAGPGVCRIWSVSHEPNVTGLEIGLSITGLGGCFDISNSIPVIRQNPDGGMISTNDELTLCVNDGEPDLITFELMGGSGLFSNWIITDESGQILTLPASPPFDFEGAGAGVCVVWHMSSEAGLQGLTEGNNLSDVMGCFDLSNGISVERDTVCGCNVDGGIIGSSSDTTICVGEGIVDTVLICVADPQGSENEIVITDSDGVILDLVPSAMEVVLTFENAGAGTCVIYNIAYEPGLLGLANGSNIADLVGCYDLSNAIQIVRVTGSDCTTSTSEVELGQMVNIFPNPARGLIRIQSSDLEVQSVEVFDARGVLVANIEGMELSDWIRLTPHVGLYYLRIYTDRGIAVKRVMLLEH